MQPKICLKPYLPLICSFIFFLSQNPKLKEEKSPCDDFITK